MALSVVGWTLIGDPLDDGPLVTSPVAGVAYTLDMAWAPAPADAAGANSVTVSCAGASINTSWGAWYEGHRVPVTGYRQIDLGWSPNGKLVWLDPAQSECGAGFWRITFPSAGSYTITVTDANGNTVGTLSVTAGTAAPAPTEPEWTVLCGAPMGRQPAKIGTLAFDGVYPAGGLDVPGLLVGGEVWFADVLPQPPLIFSWSAEKLHVFNQSGEIVAGTPVSFSTTALFVNGPG